MKRASLRNFHVPLSEDLYDKLREEAGRCRQPATELAREAIELLLKERRKRTLHEAVALYAAKHAGTASDLDVELEAASVEHLVSGGEDS